MVHFFLILELFLWIGIVFWVIIIGFTLFLFRMCLQKRARRQNIKAQMNLKQVNFASSYGLNVHELARKAPQTIHV